MSKKISQFIATETLPDGAFIDYVHNGQNFRISKDVLAQFLLSNAAIRVLDEEGVPYYVPVVVNPGA